MVGKTVTRDTSHLEAGTDLKICPLSAKLALSHRVIEYLPNPKTKKFIRTDP